jgi:Kef-type K+ transport system membrane component KefB
MTTPLPTLTALLPLSTGIALTGLLVPIGLSFLLTPMFNFPLLHSFAAGAALSSTSLGTVLALISASGLDIDLQKTKLGTALLGAAVMDDVVAFVLSEIVSLLGETDSGSSSTLGAHIGRTIGVTFGLGLVVIPFTRWIARPLYMRFTRSSYRGKVGESGLLAIMAVIFTGTVAGARYAGTSPLYGVYVGGLVISYLVQVEEEEYFARTVPERREVDEEGVPSARVVMGNPMPGSRLRRASSHPTPLALDRLSSRHSDPDLPPPSVPESPPTVTFITTFSHYVSPILLHLLLPLFFGSIGYSIPFIPLWRGKVIWKGFVYTLLMVFGKALTGLWILFWPIEGKRKALWRETLRMRLPAALLLGFAMIARGEIGLL